MNYNVFFEKNPHTFKIKVILLKIHNRLQQIRNLVRYGTVSPRSYVIDYDRKLIYQHIPKCGCTSIKRSMGFGGGNVSKDKTYHDHGIWVKHKLSKHEKGFFIFTFVRNPFDRFVSLYENQYNNNPYRYRDPDRAYYYMWKKKGFEYFIWEICHSSRFNVDEHYKSYYDDLHLENAGSNKMMPDFIGHMENFESEFKPLVEKFHLKPLERLNPSKRKDYKSYYTKETARLIYNKFRKDFELLGYDDAYKELIDDLRKGRE